MKVPVDHGKQVPGPVENSDIAPIHPVRMIAEILADKADDGLALRKSQLLWKDRQIGLWGVGFRRYEAQRQAT